MGWKADSTIVEADSSYYTADGGPVGVLGNSVTCILVTRSGAIRPGLSLLSWAWFDEADPVNFTTVVDQGEVEITDGAGSITVDIPGTSLTAGQIGTLILRSDDGVSYGVYNLAMS